MYVMCARQSLFISCKKEGIVLKTVSLEIYISMRKRKMYHLHFKALQVPILAEVVISWDTKEPDPDVSNDVKTH